MSNPTQTHFGFKPNQHVCTCGRHFGYGTLTAEERYERAAGMRQRLPMYMPEAMWAFLRDWEKHHNVPTAYMPKQPPYRNAYAD